MGNQNCNICLSNNTQHPDAKHKGFSDEVQTIIDKYRRKSIKNIEAFEQKKQSTGAIRRGLMKDGKINGYGQYFRGKTAYVGNFQNDVPQGQGILIKSMTNYHIGTFKNGKPHGQGKQKSGQNKFQGTFENGSRVEGKMETQTYTYTGTFKNNKFQGRGVMEFKNGEKYQGTFKKGKYHGSGVFKYSDSQQYTGNFKNGQLEGVGKYEWSDGSEYKGEYIANKKCGYGTFKKNGYEWVGAWQYGKRRQKNKFEEEPLVI